MYTDFHNDFLTDANSSEILEKYCKSENHIVSAIFKGKRNFSQVFKIAEKFLSKRKDNLYLAFEDMGYENFDQIEKLLALKPCYITLTWNGQNNLGGGAGCEIGLTALGKKVVKLANSLKIPIDTAHLSRNSFYQVIDLADKVVNSHTCFCAINEHIRNITNEQIKLIIEKSGVIGACLYSPFVKKGDTVVVEDYFEHIDYYVQKFGYFSLGVGTDFYGCTDLVLKDYDEFEFLKEVMRFNGYTESAINGILTKNIYNYINIEKNI